MTIPRQLDEDLIDHACSQLGKIARQRVHEGATPASAARAAVRETKALFPADWRLAVQGDDDDDEVEVWEVEHKRITPCTRVVRETQEAAVERLIAAVLARACLHGSRRATRRKVAPHPAIADPRSVDARDRGPSIPRCGSCNDPQTAKPVTAVKHFKLED